MLRYAQCSLSSHVASIPRYHWLFLLHSGSSLSRRYGMQSHHLRVQPLCIPLAGLYAPSCHCQVRLLAWFRLHVRTWRWAAIGQKIARYAIHAPHALPCRASRGSLGLRKIDCTACSSQNRGEDGCTFPESQVSGTAQRSRSCKGNTYYKPSGASG